MRHVILVLLCCSAVIHALNCRAGNGPVLIDDQWKFHRGGAQRAEQPDFDDSSWRLVDLPHDWSIEDLPGTTSPFDRDAISQVSGGFTTGGTGWYRKNLMLPDSLAGKTVYILFEGVYMNSEGWLNGQYLGSHPYGYTSFYYDISAFMHPGSANVLAVKVKNEGENSRWYSGSGIYRHVWLIVKNPVHTGIWGMAVNTSDSGAVTTVEVKNDIQNKLAKEASVQCVTFIYDKDSKQVGKSEYAASIPASGNILVPCRIKLSNAAHWSTDNPVLYSAVTEIYIEGKMADSQRTSFGIRNISFSADKGFMLNGIPLKLKGGCFHHDNGPLGAKAFDRAEERKVELMKASGFNAIRCSHNPPSPAFLDACDRLGMLVMDEAFDMWKDQKNPGDYHLYFNEWWQRDVESMVTRDRNHPSVIMWSIGNEIPNRHTPEVVGVASMIGGFIRQLDPGRPVTSAVNDLKPDKDPYFATLDVAGYNYASGGDHGRNDLYASDHERVPSRIMVGTESYPLEAFQSWMDVVDHPWVIGDFVWTGFDYIGEASIGWRGYWQEQNFFPWNLAYCGDIDICGWKRPQSYYRDVLWKPDQVSVFVTPPSPTFAQNPRRMDWSKWHWFDHVADWNWTGSEGAPLEVTVYSSCEKAELFLNGKSLGSKTVNRDTRFMAAWQVPYQPGTLKAVGYRGKKAVSASELHTVEEPVKMIMTADRPVIKADGQDLCYILVELSDASGNRDTRAEKLLDFSIEGPGTIVGVGNANPISLESYTQPHLTTWQGRCLVIVRASHNAGKIIVTAQSQGLPQARVEVEAR
jgi:beta-galactosidase